MSYVYYVAAGEVVKKLPLKSVVAGAPVRAGVGQRVADTIFLAKDFPLVPSGLKANAEFMLVNDAFRQRLWPMRRRSPQVWKKILPDNYRRVFFKQYFPGKDTDSLLKAIDQLSVVENADMRAEVLSFDIVDNEFHALLKFQFPIGIFQASANALVIINLESGILERLAVNRSRFNLILDSVSQKYFGNIPVQPGTMSARGGPDEMLVARDFNAIVQSIKASKHSLFSLGGNALLFVKDSVYVFDIIPNDSADYKMAGMFSRDGNKLRENRLLKLRKHPIYAENNLKNNVSNLVGRYPYVMLPIANTIYNLEDETTYQLDMSLGNYDYKSIQDGRPTAGLVMADVISEREKVQVLYTLNGSSLKVASFNLPDPKPITDEPVFNEGTPLASDKSIVRFDTFDRLISVDPVKKIIVFVPL